MVPSVFAADFVAVAAQAARLSANLPHLSLSYSETRDVSERKLAWVGRFHFRLLARLLIVVFAVLPQTRNVKLQKKSEVAEQKL